MQIQVENLTRTFGEVRAVDNVSFTLRSGRVYAFVGPNGAGKTTTMRVMATLDEPTAGDVLLDDVSVVEYPEVARGAVGFMPDTLPAHGDMTVHEYVDFFARAHGLRGLKLHDAVGSVQEFTGLEPLREKNLRALSKGMRQRVSLARALVHDPQILILDEPAAGLDPRARIEFRELVRMLGEAGKTFLISSHILSELSEICTDVLIIEKGCILNCGALRGDEVEVAAHRTMAMRPFGSLDTLQRVLLELPNILNVRPVAGELHAEIEGGEAEIAALLRQVLDRGVNLAAFYPVEENLETLFMRVTKGELA